MVLRTPDYDCRRSVRRAEERGRGAFLISETCEVEQSEIVVSLVADADGAGDDNRTGEDEILSSDDDLDEYLQDIDEIFMLPNVNVSYQTEVPHLSNLDTDVLVYDDDLRPDRDKAKEIFAQKTARKALERQEMERYRKSRTLNQQIDLVS